MGRIANSYPVSLKTLANAYPRLTGSVVSNTSYTTPGTTSFITAPSGAAFCRLRIWGGGGGGRGTYTLGAEYGGGGGAFSEVIFAANASICFNVVVGAGGTAGTSSANGGPGGGSYVVYSGSANLAYFPWGYTSVWAYGGGGGSFASTSGKGGITLAAYDSGTEASLQLYSANSANGSNGTTSTGGAAGGVAFGGGAGGSTLGAAGTAPGGGGAPNTSGNGGAGAAGRVEVAWFGAPSSPKLRDYLPAGTYAGKYSIGKDGNIPSSGTLKLSQFRGVNEVCMANGLAYSAYASDLEDYPSAYANAVFYFRGSNTSGFNGTMADQDSSFGVASKTSSYASPWMRNSTGYEYDNIDEVQVRRIHQGGFSGSSTVPSGSANNTWINANTDPEWHLEGIGNSFKSSWGYLELRWAANSQVFINAQSDIEVETSVSVCPTCCFTPDTLITMADRTTKPISEVKSGDPILVYDPKTGKQVAEPVSTLIIRRSRPMWKYVFADGRTLTASEEHPLYVLGKGYAAVKPVPEYKDLGCAVFIDVGDMVLDVDGYENEIVSLTEIVYLDDVYTFENSRFYANGMLVY